MDGKGEMDRTERFYKIDQLLNDMAVVPLATFLDDLVVSLATFQRDLEYIRERLYAPIQWDRDNVGAKGNAGGQGAKLVRSHGGSTQKTLKEIGSNQHEVRSHRGTTPNTLKDIGGNRN